MTGKATDDLGFCSGIILQSALPTLARQHLMTSSFIPLGPDRLHYLRLGSGPRLVLAFHGYSNSANLFQPFERFLETDCTVFSIDLPHHGRSTDWPENRDLTPADLRDLVTYCCDHFGVRQCSLLAYSLGGRISLKIIEDMPERIDRAVLAAPDGMRFDPFYFFVTRTAPGRGFFNDVLGRPQRYFRFLDALKARGVLNEAKHSFTRHYLETDSSRGLLRKAWPALRQLIPRIPRVKRAIARHNIPVHIFAGRNDRVIPLSGATALAKGVPTVHLHILDKGHRLLEGGTVRDASQALLG